MELKPLNLGLMAKSYEENLEISSDEALKMAKLTKGYAFAFQVMGYFTWKNGGDYLKVLPNIKAYLEDYVYDKIWSEVSTKDKLFLYGMAKSQDNRASQIKEITKMSSGKYSTYRDRLIKKGIIISKEHGCVSFTLPFFEEYIIMHYDETV